MQLFLIVGVMDRGGGGVNLVNECVCIECAEGECRVWVCWAGRYLSATRGFDEVVRV